MHYHDSGGLQEPTKLCNTCGKAKPLGEMVVDPTRPSGRRPKCKACQAAYYQEWISRDPARV